MSADVDFPLSSTTWTGLPLLSGLRPSCFLTVNPEPPDYKATSKTTLRADTPFRLTFAWPQYITEHIATNSNRLSWFCHYLHSDFSSQYEIMHLVPVRNITTTMDMSSFNAIWSLRKLQWLLLVFIFIFIKWTVDDQGWNWTVVCQEISVKVVVMYLSASNLVQATQIADGNNSSIGYCGKYPRCCNVVYIKAWICRSWLFV